MIQKLRCRLTLLMTGLTALVLACALIVTWHLSEEQYKTSSQTLFANNFASLCDRLSDAESITDRWLAEQEYGTGCLLFLQDNGSELHYAGSLSSQTPRDELEALAFEGAHLFLDHSQRDSAGAVIQQEAHFSMSGTMGDNYAVSAVLLPRDKHGSYLLFVFLQEQSYLTRHMFWSALQYIGLFIAGCLLLAGISYWLSGKALAPTGQALRQQKEFIAAASHELRSPLAVIKASLQAMEERLAPERQENFLHTALSEANRMAHLTDDLLLLANGDLDTVPAHLQSVAPDNVCIEMYDRFYPLAKQQQHSLTLTLPEGPVPMIQADLERLEQLLSILLHNALEHTPENTPIELVLSYGAKGSVSFSVVDHGPGIPDTDKSHIFDRFYRADASRTDKRNFGLGLSVARELARLHKAALTVSDTPGGGATFQLQFS